ncbi:hypothetical protein LZ190_23615, partial [Rhodovulum sulfidophilum]|nr:hypothetical protein [Rhodovulum sulfidophilum]
MPIHPIRSLPLLALIAATPLAAQVEPAPGLPEADVTPQQAEPAPEARPGAAGDAPAGQTQQTAPEGAASPAASTEAAPEGRSVAQAER